MRLAEIDTPESKQPYRKRAKQELSALKYEPKLNELGLPVKKLYTTSDVCKVLKITPDTFRHRIRAGFYPESGRAGDKRRFTLDEIKKIVEITTELDEKNVIRR